MIQNGFTSFFKQNFFKKRKNRSFFSTLVLSFLLISILTTLLLTSFLMGIFVKASTTSAENYNRQLQTQTNFAIDRLQESVDNLARSLLNNYKIQAYLSVKDIQNITPVLASQEIRSQLLVLAYYVDGLYLYNSHLDLLYSSKSGHQWTPELYEDPELSAHLRDPEFLMSNYGKPMATARNPQTGNANIIRYYYTQSANSKSAPNVLVIDVHTNALTDSILNMQRLSSESASNFLLMDDEGAYITSVLDSSTAGNGDWLNAAIAQLSAPEDLNASYLKINGTRYLKVPTTANVYGWMLVNFIPARVIFQDVLSASVISLVIAIVVFALSYLVCLHFAKKLNSPIETLVHTLSGTQAAKNTYTLSPPPQEIQTILSAVSSLQENNQQLSALQQKTRYTSTQSYLRSLVLNINQDSPGLKLQRLEELNLTYLNQERLCMALLKIDDYPGFLKSHDTNELWVIRFSVVNITEELAGAHFTCNAFSMDNDKFVLLIASESQKSDVGFEETLLSTFHSIQENMDSWLHFTVSIAFSTVFQGLSQLSSVYRNVQSALLLKMRYGHNCIISPYQIEDVSEEPFQFSYRSVLQLVDELAAGRFDNVWDAYLKQTELLFFSDYDEIMSFIIHLSYNIYERISEKFPMLKDAVTEEFKSFQSELRDAEISDDVQLLVKTFLKNICTGIQEHKENPAQQSTSLVAEKIVQIIQKEYANPALCLTSIADEVGLSSNYVGHMFKQYTQKSVSQYILEVRMDLVGDYLKNTTLPLNKILERVGLEKNNYFYTRFKNYFGMSLNEYRQQFSASPEQ